MVMSKPANPLLLVLDDEARIGRLLVRIAKRSGWCAEHASTVLEFRARLAERRPDGIMLDLNLGDEDGVDQLRFLHEAGYDGPIVLMSGFDDRVLHAACEIGNSLGLHIGSTLSKPASFEEIGEVIGSITRGEPAGATPPDADHGRSSREPISAARVDAGLAAGELRLEFQPIVDLRCRSVQVFEALIRWDHPELGLVMPDRFIPVSEQDAGVIDRISMWVVRAATAQARRLKRTAAPSAMAVNVSARNLRSRDFPDRLLDVVAECDSAPSALTLEITESATAHDGAVTLDILTRLRLKGFRLAMDDFGTGFSSLKALQNSPFSEIKIDKSFVGGMGTSRDARTIVKTVGQLAREMGLKTVAEGAETADVVEQLLEFGIDSVQGYHVGRPMPGDRLPSWLKEWSTAASPQPHQRPN